MKKAVLTFILVLFFANTGFAASIIYKTGTVKIMRKGEAFWISANPQAIVSEGDKVKTFKNSSCEIAFDKESRNVLRVEEDTEITIDKFGQTRVSMEKGKVLSRIKNLEQGSTFEIRTPTVVTGAAGTGWGVDCDGRRTTVLVFENDIYILNPSAPSERRIVREGNKTTMERSQRVGVVEFMVLTRIENDRWGSWVEELEERLEEKGRMDRIREIDKRFDDRFGTAE